METNPSHFISTVRKIGLMVPLQIFIRELAKHLANNTFPTVDISDAYYTIDDNQENNLKRKVIKLEPETINDLVDHTAILTSIEIEEIIRNKKIKIEEDY